MSAEGQTWIKRRLEKGKKRWAGESGIGFFGIVFCLLVFLYSGLVFAAEQAPNGQAGEAGLSRYRVFSLKHISAEQGKEYLTQFGIETVSLLPSPNTLLVTASAAELIKVSSVLEIVDAEQQYVIKSICAVSEIKNLPSSGKIASEVGNISIGTFTELPERGPKTRVIIDVRNSKLMAIAPAKELEKITAAIGRVQNKETGVLQPTESGEIFDSNKPVQQADEQRVKSDKPDELELLEKPAEDKTVKAGPDEGKKTVTTVAEPNEGKAVSTGPNKSTASEAKPKQKESADSEEIEQPADQSRKSEEIGTESKTTTEEPQTGQEPNEIEETNNAVSEPTVQSHSYEPEPLPIGDEELTLDLPEKLNVIDLLDLVGKYLKLDYMYDPAKVAGEVTLKLQGSVKVRELYPLAESVLKFRNFVMTRKGNLVTIVPSGEVLDIDPTLMYDEKGKVEYGDVIVTRLFNLQYIDTASAKNLLGQMKLGANITDIPATGTLIVTDYAYRMGRIEELLNIIDKPGAPKQFKSRQLRYTMAKTLAPKVQTLVEQLGAMSVSIAQPAAAPQPAPRGRRITQPSTLAPTPTAPSGKPTVYLDVDERTNRILMIGFENELAVVDGLIDSLDVQQQDLRTLRIYDIQHVDAQEVRNKLQELGIIGAGEAVPSGRVEAPKAAAPAAPAAAAPAAASQGLVEEPQVVIIAATNSLLVNATAEQHIQIAMIIGYVDSVTLEDAIPYEIYPLENQNPKDLAEVLQQLIEETVKDKEGKIQQVVKKQEDIEIVPDENTFSIIVYASKKNQEWIKKLIKTLDRRRPQVLIDVSLVEINQKNAFEYELNLVANAKDFVTGNIAVKSGTLPITAAAGKIIEGGFNSTGTTAATTFQGFFSDDKIQALLTAIDTKKYGRVLAKPKILVNDNEEGKINTTQTTYISETTTNYQPATTGVTPGVVTATTFKPYDAKIELVIKPHISEGDLLRLEVSMVREDFKNLTATKPPDYTKSNVTTIVTVPDGSTIILGGLTKLNQEKGTSKVPLLGDIPIAGALFRGVNNTTDDTHLYVFVKAVILRPGGIAGGPTQLTAISRENKGVFEEYERRFQEHQSIPGIKPEPIDPLNVLEAE